MEKADIKILGAGNNWTSLGGRITMGLAGYNSALPKGSTVSLVNGDPGQMCIDGPYRVADRTYHMGITTPASFLKLAVEGRDPFDKPLPLRVLATFPHDDRMVFAVKKSTGLKSLEGIREKKYPLKVLTPPPGSFHPSVWGAEAVLAEYGFSLADIEKWGGKLVINRSRGTKPLDTDPEGEFDAVFDEAVMTRRWKLITDANDITFLPIGEEQMKRLEARGFKRAKLEKDRFRGVESDISVLDFSDWVLYCREDMDEELAYMTIAAIDEQKKGIEALFPQPFSPMSGPCDLRRLAANPAVPLHKGAARYYEEKGFL